MIGLINICKSGLQTDTTLYISTMPEFDTLTNIWVMNPKKVRVNLKRLSLNKKVRVNIRALCLNIDNDGNVVVIPPPKWRQYYGPVDIC